MFISIGNNRKLGNMGSWNIPAVKTCPYATNACKSVCYVKKGTFSFPSNQAIYQRNYQLSRSKSFIKTIIQEIRNSGVRYFRVHASGDFYSADYVMKWVEIARKVPDVTFYAYTRSWRGEEFWAALTELAGLKNFKLLFSLDKENIVDHNHKTLPVELRRVKTVYMSFEERAKKAVNIVFRVNHLKLANKGVVVKNLNGQVCPRETGLKSEPIKNLTCQTCKLCFK